MTECTQKELAFQPLGRRKVAAQFNGGQWASDGGRLLLREVEARTGIIRQFAACFRDHRDRRLITHDLRSPIAQRVFGLALGYEDLNDHDQLRVDPMLGLLVGREDLSALAGKSTLNRFELTPVGAGPARRYKKVEVQTEPMERVFVEIFIQSHVTPPPGRCFVFAIRRISAATGSGGAMLGGVATADDGSTNRSPVCDDHDRSNAR